MIRHSTKKRKGSKKKSKEDWELKDFIQAVDQVMNEQEKKYPPIRQVHARLTPEWKEISHQIAIFLSSKDEDGQKLLLEKIVDKGPIATRVLLDLLLSLKKGNP